jgi:hypothetical protein
VLLLVLILILIAFGLLVVALLSGSVLWAWVSVAVSAVAALVLIVDGLQRRAALRAARAAENDPVAAGVIDYHSPEVEAATEILPVVPPAAAARSDADSDLGRLHSGEAGGERSPSFDQGPLGQRTVAMSTRQPPGSDGGPSGATAGPPSTPGISPSVTAGGGDTSGRMGADGDRPGSEATVVVSRAERADRADRDRDRDREDGSGDAGERVALGKDRDAGVGPADREVVVRPSDPTMQGVAPADAPPPEQIVAERMALQPPTEMDLHHVGDGAGPTGDRADRSVDRAEEPAGVEVDAEAPEEQRDPAAAELVATLPDEVVVIDEQPRYHLTDCRALAAKPVIPLPVREAVELGFTPCGWCTPDTRLAERHPARAQ